MPLRHRLLQSIPGSARDTESRTRAYTRQWRLVDQRVHGGSSCCIALNIACTFFCRSTRPLTMARSFSSFLTLLFHDWISRSLGSCFGSGPGRCGRKPSLHPLANSPPPSLHSGGSNDFFP